MKNFIFPFSVFLILILFSSQSYAQQFGWAHGIGSKQYFGFDQGLGIATDSLGNVYSTGSFGDTVDFDPGPGIFNLAAIRPREAAYILKLDNSGAFEWAKQIGDSYSVGHKIQIDPMGNIIVCGIFWDTCDLDPGPGVFELMAETPDPTSRAADIFILKLDPQGDFLWAKALHGPDGEEVRGLDIDANGNIFITGDFRDSLDADPGSGTPRLISGSQYSNGFIAKYNPSGALEWAGVPSSPDISISYDLTLDEAGNPYIVGSFSDLIDMDPGPGVDTIRPYNPFQRDGFVIKMDNAGNYLWHKQFAGGIVSCKSVETSPYGNIIIAGSYHYFVDFNPGQNDAIMSGTDYFVVQLDEAGNPMWSRSIQGTQGQLQSKTHLEVSPVGDIFFASGFQDTIDLLHGPGQCRFGSADRWYDVFLLKLNRFGDFVYGGYMGGKENNYLNDLHLDRKGNLLVAGSFRDTMDIDPDTGVHFLAPSYGRVDYDIFLGKLTQGPCWDMGFRMDSLRNVSCTNDGFVRFRPINPKLRYDYLWKQDGSTNAFFIPETSGTYTVDIIDSRGCNKTIHTYIDGPSQRNQMDWKLTQVSSGYRPGLPQQSWLQVRNDGCITDDNEVYMVEDELMEGTRFSISPDRQVGDTLFWDLPGYSWDNSGFKTVLERTVSLRANIDDVICEPNLVKIKLGESSSDNNSHPAKGIVINSYDPNDVRVSPAGFCEKGLTPPNTRLTYTIRFQNTGTADAINVVITDSIDTYLDLSTFRLRSMSHEPMTVDINEGVVRFSFPNIHLPDSNANEPESHGYVVFSLDQKANLSDETEITNKAEIYFDFNEPIITNTALTTIYSGTITDEIEVSGGRLTAAQQGATYQWIDCNNNRQPISSATSRSFQPSANGRYAVKITVQGCTFSSVCIDVMSVGIELTEFAQNTRIYPNPTQGAFYVDLPKRQKEVQVSIFDHTGKLIQQQLFSNTGSIQSAFEGPAGIYLVKVRSEDGEVSFKLLRK